MTSLPETLPPKPEYTPEQIAYGDERKRLLQGIAVRKLGLEKFKRSEAVMELYKIIAPWTNEELQKYYNDLEK